MTNVKRIIRWLALCLLIAAPIGAFAQEAAKEAAAPTVHKTSFFEMLKHGGWAMYPLGACSVAAITFAIMGFQRIRVSAMMPAQIVADVRSAAERQDYVKVAELAQAHDTFFTRPLAEGMKHFNPDDLDKTKATMGEAIGEVIAREETKLSFVINFLSLMTSMSPMWGLIGTVSGMIGAFSRIGTGAMGKPEQLAANIGEALICTATGLVIAVFSMGCYFFFRNKLNTLIKDAEQNYTHIIHSLVSGETVAES